MIVVCDTSPICYLLLIGEIELLPQLYGQVLIPQAIQKELADERSPTVVQAWIIEPRMTRSHAILASPTSAGEFPSLTSSRQAF